MKYFGYFQITIKKYNNVMTREEEIHKAAEEFAFSHKTETPDLYDAINDFYYGAKWADENPQMRKDYEFLFMLKKRELIKKACEWMKANIKFETVSYADLWDQSDIDLLVTDFTTIDEMIENFEKTMGE
jgi:hypothetical protein